MPPPRRILAIWLARLAVDRWRHHEGCALGEGADAEPVALITETAHGPRIDTANEAGRAAGAARGMMLADARTLCPRLKAVPSDPAGDLAFLERLAVWAGRWGPWTALDPPDGLLVDVTGVAHLFGGEARLLADVAARFAGWGEGRRGGLLARTAIAPTAGAAWALAHHAASGTILGDAARAAAEARMDGELSRRVARAMPGRSGRSGGVQGLAGGSSPYPASPADGTAPAGVAAAGRGMSVAASCDAGAQAAARSAQCAGETAPADATDLPAADRAAPGRAALAAPAGPPIDQRDAPASPALAPPAGPPHQPGEANGAGGAPSPHVARPAPPVLASPSLARAPGAAAPAPARPASQRGSAAGGRGTGPAGESGRAGGAGTRRTHTGDRSPSSAEEEHLLARLSGLPVAALRLDDDVLLVLKRLGLKQLGDLAGRFEDTAGRDALQRRFRNRRSPAANPLIRLDQLIGRVPEPLLPVVAVAPPLVQRRLLEPIRHRDLLDQVLRDLAADMARELEGRGSGARRLELGLWRVDGEVVTRRLELAAATREAGHICRLFAAKLDDVDAGFGIEMVRLTAAWAEPLGLTQTDLEAAAEEHGTSLAACIDRLAVRLGATAVRRPVPFASHLPERAQRWQPPLEPEPASQGELAFHARPLKMLDRPEKIAVLYATPDGYPRQFRWRGQVHEVARVEGPERIAPEWWREKGSARLRDYYRIEDSAGRRYWIYRAGIAGDGRGGLPDWFLQGLCA